MPNEETTTKFKVDISELKKSMQQAKREISLANSEFKEASSSMDDWSKSSDGISAKLKQLDSTLKSQKTILNSLEGQYEAVVAEQGEGSAAADRLKVAINNQKAAINKTQRDIDTYESSLKDVSKAEKIAAATGKDVSEVLDDIGDEAKDAGDGFTVFKGAVATFAGNALTGLANAIKGGISNIINLADETREYRTELAKLETGAKQAGASTDYIKNKWQDMGAVLGDEGAVTEGLNNLMAAGFTTEKEMDAITSSLEGAALKWKDTLKFEGLSDGLQETLATGSAVGQFGELLERSGVNLETFDKGLAKCKTSAEKQNYVLQELSKLGLSDVSEAYREQNADLIEANKANGDYTDKMAQLGGKVEPVITAVKQGFSDLLGKALELVEGVDFAAVGEKIKGAFSDFSENVLPKIKDGFQWIIDNKDMLIAGLVGIGAGFAVFQVASLINGVVTAFKAFKAANEGATVAQWLLNAAMNANPIMLIVTVIAAVIAAIVTFIATNDKARAKIVSAWEKVKEFVGKSIKTICKFFTETIPQALKSMINWFKELPGKIWAFLVNVITKITTWRANMIAKAKDAALGFINAVVDYVKQLPGKVWTWLKNVVSKVGSWASELVSKGKAAASKLVTSVTTTVKELPGKIKGVGLNLAKGVVKGITNSLSWVKSRIKEWVGNVKDFLLKLFKIKSPSRWARDEVGKMITAGIVVGLDDGKTEVMKVMEELNGDLLESEQKYLDESERLKDSQSETDKKYLEELKEVADKERKIYDALAKDVENEKQAIVDSFNTKVDEIFTELEAVEAKQDSIKGKLAEGKNTYKVTEIYGRKVLKLDTASSETSALAGYSALLDQLAAKRGELPAEITNYLAEMGVDEGIAYVQAMLNASDKEFSEYISSLEEKQRLADEIGKKITSGQVAQLSASFEAEFDALPEDFFGIGLDSAELFGEGFMQQLKAVLDDVKLTISSALSSVSIDVKKSGSSGETASGGNGGVVNNFTQNNYSPQPLNRTALYRNTKNLLGFAGGAK